MRYANELQNATTCNSRLYADDACLVVNNSSKPLFEQTCNSEMHHLKRWCDANKLQINPKKSVIIYIPTKLIETPVYLKVLYRLNDLQLTFRSKFIQVLGVIADRKKKTSITYSNDKKQTCQSCGYFQQSSFYISFLDFTFPLFYPDPTSSSHGTALQGCTEYLTKLRL